MYRRLFLEVVIMDEVCAPQGVSVLVPVYNEVQSVRTTLVSLHTVMTALGRPFELIVINDGSWDGSTDEIAAAPDQHLVVIYHARNQGYGASLTRGLQRARYPLVVITDADGTYPVTRIPALVEALDTHAMAIGQRFVATMTSVSPLRRFAKLGLRRLAESLTGHEIPDLNSGLRAMRRDAILPLLPILPTRFSWTSTVTVGLLTRQEPVVFVPITYHPRQGASKFHPVLDTLRAVHCIVRAAWWCHVRRRWSRAVVLFHSQLHVWMLLQVITLQEKWLLAVGQSSGDNASRRRTDVISHSPLAQQHHVHIPGWPTDEAEALRTTAETRTGVVMAERT